MMTRPRFGFRSSEPFWSQPTNNVPSGAALIKIGYEMFGGEANTVASNSGGYLTLFRISGEVRGGFSAAKATSQRQSAIRRNDKNARRPHPRASPVGAVCL